MENIQDTQKQDKERIYNACIEELNEKGIKFTMDDIAKRLSMSKKTLYTMFEGKEALFLETIDYGFSKVKESERQIIENAGLTTLEKIRKVIIVLPDQYQNLDFSKLYDIRDKAPKLYKKVETKLENDWEPTIALLEQGMREGVIRPIKIPILKGMIEAAFEHFLTSDILVASDISYEKALEEMMDILMLGIKK